MTCRRLGLGRLAGAVIVMIVGIAGCSGDDDADATPSDGAGPAATSAASAAPPTSTAPAPRSTEAATATDTSASTGDEPAADSIDVLGVGSIVLEGVAEPGPHPVLAWQPVPDAATYWLTVTDGAGRPFWAWTGTATTVRVGGGPSDELNQTAAIHEPMTWRVAALDADGALVALSEPGDITPR